ncbi:MAG: signal peptidase I [Actinomycetota bacterium]
MSTVQQVARELGMTSQEVIARLKAMGQPADSHLTPVDDSVADRLRRETGTSRVAEQAPDIEGNGARTVASSPETAEAMHAPTKEEPEKKPAEEPATKKTASEPAKKKKQSSLFKQIAELPLLIVLAFIIAIVIKIFLVQAFFIPSASMNPTLVRGDRVLVEKVSYRFGDPARGQVIVFARETAGEAPDLPWSEDVRNFFRELLGLPTGEETDFIKRVVAVGGDVISYTGNNRTLVVNGDKVDEPYIKGGRDTGSSKIMSSTCKSMKLEPGDGGCRVPAGTVFVMGDNRSNSMDSRVIGPVDVDKIVGRAWLIIWPPKDFGTL